MDGSQLPPYFWEPNWDESSDNHRRPPALSLAPRPDELSFGFPADYGVGPSSAPLMDPTGLSTSVPPLPPDLFLFAGSVPSWDSAPASSWLPELAQPSGIRYESSIRTPWDDSSFPAPSTGSSAGDFSGDGYGINMAETSEYASSRFSSPPPPSIPADDNWVSQGWSSDNSRPVSAAPSIVYGDPIGESPPSVSVEIGAWIDATSWTTVHPSVDSDINPVDQVQDIDAHLGWDSKPSARHPATESVASGSSSLSITGSGFQGDDPSHSYVSASVTPTAAVLPNHSNSSAQMLNPDALRQLARCCQVHWLAAVSDSLYSSSN
ncbi:hypothetical protein B0H16DRAFT_1648944 [Mycena metata]|uniref:Uncharacterized protein n=1 Tax=Mycena metata TaxID=1033252 RepID=A0AAD7DMV6_9AGAR|nr:hypothetical protein B0H16DRAFT_1648944 [Mycena metata]